MLIIPLLTGSIHQTINNKTIFQSVISTGEVNIIYSNLLTFHIHDVFKAGLQANWRFY